MHAPGSSIWLNITDAGPLGAKFRVKITNTGRTGPTVLVPPLDEDQMLHSKLKAGTRFRTQFSCINWRDDDDRPETDFEGTIHY